jgi:hypothetical protein
MPLRATTIALLDLDAPVLLLVVGCVLLTLVLIDLTSEAGAANR